VIVASSPWVSVSICYLVVFGSISLLAWRSRARGRRLAPQVPEDQRSWMTTSTEPSPPSAPAER
jgi:hypothetical protein